MLLIVVGSIHHIIKMIMNSSLLKRGKELLRCIISVFLFLLVSHSALGQPFDAIINLGGDCQVSYQLYINGLRTYALPFDILITPYEALHNMLVQNFEGFMEPENFVLVLNEKKEKYILDQKYGSRLLHDFTLEEEFLKDFPSISEKYLRRIERLSQLIKLSEYPLFIRKIVTREQTLALRDLLSDLRENRPFMLVALDGTDDITTDWHIENVRNFYLRQPQLYTWKGDPEAWKEIFLALDLCLSNSTQSSKEY